MEKQLQTMFAKIIESVIEDPCHSIDLIHLELKQNQIALNCLNKNGETLSLAFNH